MTKLVQFVALTAVLGCFLPTMITAQTWGPVQFCPRNEKAVGFQLYFENFVNRRLEAIVIICTRGSRISSPPGFHGIPGRTQFCRRGRYLASCQLQVERPGRNTPANNLDCRCNDGQLLHGDGSNVGIKQNWSPPCRNGIVGIQTKSGRPPHPFYIYEARFPCFRTGGSSESSETTELDE